MYWFAKTKGRYHEVIKKQQVHESYCKKGDMTHMMLQILQKNNSFKNHEKIYELSEKNWNENPNCDSDAEIIDCDSKKLPPLLIATRTFTTSLISKCVHASKNMYPLF